jgi:RNA recognition motif-containing protein
MTTAYVANLPWHTTEDGLMAFLEAHGITSVVSVRIVQDGGTGRSMGYGFIECTGPEALDHLCRSLNGVAFDGRPLVVEPARAAKRRG